MFEDLTMEKKIGGGSERGDSVDCMYYFDANISRIVASESFVSLFQ